MHKFYIKGYAFDWQHLHGHKQLNDMVKDEEMTKRMTTEEMEEVVRLTNAGWPVRKIANKLGYSKATVQKFKVRGLAEQKDVDPTIARVVTRDESQRVIMVSIKRPPWENRSAV